MNIRHWFAFGLMGGLVLAGCGKGTVSSPEVSVGPASAASVAPAYSHVAQGSILRVILQTDISSDKSDEGDPIRAILADDVMANGRVELRKGTDIYGEILEAAPAAKSDDKKGNLSFVFNEIEGPHGRIPVLLSVISAHMDQSQADETARTRTQFASTAIGAILGRQVAKNRDQKKGKGLAVGAAAGLVVGTLISRQQGVDVEMASGAQIKLRVDGEISTK